eukprot:scaffold264932_cov32-Tisochrysis_lutea.AAC.1
MNTSMRRPALCMARGRSSRRHSSCTASPPCTRCSRRHRNSQPRPNVRTSRRRYRTRCHGPSCARRSHPSGCTSRRSGATCTPRATPTGSSRPLPIPCNAHRPARGRARAARDSSRRASSPPSRAPAFSFCPASPAFLARSLPSSLPPFPLSARRSSSARAAGHRYHNSHCCLLPPN